jgi:hypothetical protein
MADFLIGDVKQVRELDHDNLVNAHLNDGWALLLVRQGSNVGHSPVSGELETYTLTSYVVGWRGEAEAKSLADYEEQMRAASRVDTPDDTFPHF